MPHPYLMEHTGEIARLEIKTDREALADQAGWAGLRPGMRVLDAGCGAGVTTAMLFELTGPGGTATGLDFSAERIAHAQASYGRTGVEFVCRDFYAPLDDLGSFDFIWVRFVLEYHRAGSARIVEQLSRLLAPGGIFCLIDLDQNCLNHHGMPPRLERANRQIMEHLAEKADFDPHMGRKLYGLLYDLGLEEIAVTLRAHHLIYGPLREVDRANWHDKLDVAVRQSGYDFPDYPGGYREFAAEFDAFFRDPRRFTYTPLIACRARRPA